MIKMWFKKIIDKHFKAHCPECGSVMDNVYLDMSIDKLVHKCRNCGKEWV